MYGVSAQICYEKATNAGLKCAFNLTGVMTLTPLSHFCSCSHSNHSCQFSDMLHNSLQTIQIYFCSSQHRSAIRRCINSAVFISHASQQYFVKILFHYPLTIHRCRGKLRADCEATEIHTQRLRAQIRYTTLS
jgi:hypothetical protein